MIKAIKVDIEFYNLITKFIEDFNKINGIKISYPKASKIITVKIKRLGGLIVE